LKYTADGAAISTMSITTAC